MLQSLWAILQEHNNFQSLKSFQIDQDLFAVIKPVEVRERDLNGMKSVEIRLWEDVDTNRVKAGIVIFTNPSEYPGHEDFQMSTCMLSENRMVDFERATDQMLETNEDYFLYGDPIGALGPLLSSVDPNAEMITPGEDSSGSKKEMYPVERPLMSKTSSEVELNQVGMVIFRYNHIQFNKY